MSFVRTNVANDQHVTASAYVAYAYACACVVSVNQALLFTRGRYEKSTQTSLIYSGCRSKPTQINQNGPTVLLKNELPPSLSRDTSRFLRDMSCFSQDVSRFFQDASHFS